MALLSAWNSVVACYRHHLAALCVALFVATASLLPHSVDAARPPARRPAEHIPLAAADGWQPSHQLPFSTNWWHGGEAAMVDAMTSHDTFALFGANWDGHCKSFIASAWPQLPVLLQPSRPDLQLVLYDCGGAGGSYPEEWLCRQLLGDRMQYFTFAFFSPALALNGSLQMRSWSYQGGRDAASILAFLSDVEADAGPPGRSYGRWSQEEERRLTDWLRSFKQRYASSGVNHSHPEL